MQVRCRKLDSRPKRSTLACGARLPIAHSLCHTQVTVTSEVEGVTRAWSKDHILQVTAYLCMRLT